MTTIHCQVCDRDIDMSVMTKLTEEPRWMTSDGHIVLNNSIASCSSKQLLHCAKCGQDVSIAITRKLDDERVPWRETLDGHGVLDNQVIVLCPVEQQFIDLVDNYSRNRDNAGRDYYAAMKDLEENRQREMQKLFEKCGPNSSLKG